MDLLKDSLAVALPVNPLAAVSLNPVRKLPGSLVRTL
jgi:hypothetical protein